jgi:hypothetical protein
MTAEDDADPAFPMHRVEEIWPLKYDKLKGINMPLGGVTKPFEGRDAKVSVRFKEKVEEHAVSLIMQSAFNHHTFMY